MDCFVASLLAMTRIIPNRPASYEVVILRHRVSPPASPMTGSSRVSSMPQLLGSNTDASEYWIARFRGRRRFGTSVFIKHTSAFPRRAAPELLLEFRPREKEGAALPQGGSGATLRRERGMPGARCTRSPLCGKKHRGRSHRYTGITRHPPRNGFNDLLRTLPGDRAFLSPSPREWRQVRARSG